MQVQKYALRVLALHIAMRSERLHGEGDVAVGVVEARPVDEQPGSQQWSDSKRTSLASVPRATRGFTHARKLRAVVTSPLNMTDFDAMLEVG